MEEADACGARLSPSWRREELRRLRRIRRRSWSDPLRARPPPSRPAPATPAPAQAVVWVGGGRAARPETERLLGAGSGAAAGRRSRAARDVCSYLCFWKRIAGIVIAVSVILLLMWFSLNPPRLLQLEPCPDDWLYYKKKCYYDSGAAADWDSSRKFCSAHGASLVVIDNCQELNFIIYRIHTTDFWIGLYKRGNEFFWVNGESFDTDLFHVNTSDDGDCVHIDIQPLTPPEAAPHSRAGFAPLVSLIPTQTPSRAQLAM